MQVFAATKFWSDDPSVMRKLIALKKDAICLSTVSAESGDCLDLVTDELTQAPFGLAGTANKSTLNTLVAFNATGNGAVSLIGCSKV